MSVYIPYPVGPNETIAVLVSADFAEKEDPFQIIPPTISQEQFDTTPRNHSSVSSSSGTRAVIADPTIDQEFGNQINPESLSATKIHQQNEYPTSTERAYVINNFPLLDQNLSVFASDESCSAALSMMKRKEEKRIHRIAKEVHMGSTFMAPRRYLHKFAKQKDEIVRFGRNLSPREIHLENYYDRLILLYPPVKGPIEGETITYGSKIEESHVFI